MDFFQLGFEQSLYDWQSMSFLYNMPVNFSFSSMPLFPFTNIFQSYNFNMLPMTDYFSYGGSSSYGTSSASADKINSIAASYKGNYSEAQGKAMFATDKNHGGGYCADFATYCAKKAYPNYPKSMVTPSPVVLRNEATKYGIYKSMPSSDKVNWAKQNIRKGNLLITDGSGSSGLHVVIVDSICQENGEWVVKCHSGNDGGGVKYVSYPIERGRYSKKKGRYQMIQGVINLERFA